MEVNMIKINTIINVDYKTSPYDGGVELNIPVMCPICQEIDKNWKRKEYFSSIIAARQWIVANCIEKEGKIYWLSVCGWHDSFVLANDGTCVEDLEGTILSHGLAAFRSVEYRKNLAFILDNPQIELCCSYDTEAIGPIGIFVDGKVLCASNKDLWSEIGIDGKRYINTNNYIPFDSNSVDWDHREFIITDVNVRGIWVKTWADENIKRYARAMSEDTGMPLVLCAERHSGSHTKINWSAIEKKDALQEICEKYSDVIAQYE